VVSSVARPQGNASIDKGRVVQQHRLGLPVSACQGAHQPQADTIFIVVLKSV